MEDTLNENIHLLAKDIEEEYKIDPEDFSDQNIKRGLRNADGTGVVAGVSKIGSVQGYYIEDGRRKPMEGKLYYRGISLEDIVEAHQKDGTFGYDEVAYLLLLGKLPTKEQLATYRWIVSQARKMPASFTEDLILRAPSKDIMNQLGKSVLALYSYDDNPDDISPENVLRQSFELIGRVPIITANAYAAKRHYFDGESLVIHNPDSELSSAENLLLMSRETKSYTYEEAHLLDLMMILHAEHSSNNSTFVCRALTSSGTDTYSAISGAMGSLKGPLHGGANAAVMHMFRDIKEHIGNTPTDEKLSAYLNDILDGKANDGSGKIYGLGHAIYTISDPRCKIIKKYAEKLAVEKNQYEDLLLMESIERLGIPMIMERKKQTMPMCANIDMYSGLIYGMLGIPAELYTPLFACARTAGWCAHRLEEIMTSGRIMRPAYRAVSIAEPYVEIDKR